MTWIYFILPLFFQVSIIYQIQHIGVPERSLPETTYSSCVPYAPGALWATIGKYPSRQILSSRWQKRFYSSAVEQVIMTHSPHIVSCVSYTLDDLMVATNLARTFWVAIIVYVIVKMRRKPANVQRNKIGIVLVIYILCEKNIECTSPWSIAEHCLVLLWVLLLRARQIESLCRSVVMTLISKIIYVYCWWIR